MPDKAIKLLDLDAGELEILAIPFGGPIDGKKDFEGEYFSAKTDLCLDWFPDQRPLLYHHGLDGGPGTEVIGYVDCKSFRTDDDGVWVKGQLNQRSKYFAQIKKLLKADALSGSSGALPHLVKRAKDGHLDRWPYIEQSLTPSPMNPYSVATYAEAAKHFKGIDLDLAPEADLAAKAGQMIPAEEGNGDAPQGSYEDLIQDVSRLLRPRYATGGVVGLPLSGYAYPVATFPADGQHQAGYAIVRYFGNEDRDDEEAPGYFRVEFTIGPDGDPILGAASPLQKVYVPAGSMDAEDATKALTMVPLALATAEAITVGQVVLRQAEAVAARRKSQHRELSTANQQHLTLLADELLAAGNAIKALATPLPPVAEATTAARQADRDRRLQLLALEA